MKIRTLRFFCPPLLALLWVFHATVSLGEELNRNLKPETEDEDEAPSIFKDMGVIQNKAIKKAKKVLLSPNFSMDFSDGPVTMYGVNLGVGYALSDFMELYFTGTPYFISTNRSIVKKVEDLGLTIRASRPQRQYGAEILWAPFYGKDSIGVKSIIRSDTFLKFGVHNIIYQFTGSGLRFNLGVGKTYFLQEKFGFRVTVSGNYMQRIMFGVKSFNFVTIIESGFMIYL